MHSIHAIRTRADYLNFILVSRSKSNSYQCSTTLNGFIYGATKAQKVRAESYHLNYLQLLSFFTNLFTFTSQPLLSHKVLSHTVVFGFSRQLTSVKKSSKNPLYTTCSTPNSRQTHLATNWWTKRTILLLFFTEVGRNKGNQRLLSWKVLLVLANYYHRVWYSKHILCPHQG